MKQARALIIDDEPDIRELLDITLIRMGIDTVSVATIGEAKQELDSQPFSLCLTDMNLPDGNGIELVRHIQSDYPDLPVAMITAYGSVETAITALKAGAFDFISKPVDLGQLRDLVSSALKLTDSSSAIIGNESPTGEELLLGSSDEIKRLQQQINKLARSQAPVYISGESGCGKELVARQIHNKGPRSNSPFVPVNCGAIPSELMESEFFGHRKGSFSGAIDDKSGLFQAAQGGTLFLDEVADLPMSMQVKLLRAIQEKAVRPVGSQKEEKIDVRILSATHKDLEQMVANGDFRQDLFYRINVIKLEVPSLREHREDIPLLAKRFLKDIAEECGIDDASIANDALSALESYGFPGNVRELENIIERAFTLCENNTIREADLQLDEGKLPAEGNNASPAQKQVVPSTEAAPAKPVEGIAPRPDNLSLEDYLEAIERREIEAALLETKWNRTAAAKKLGLTFRALRYRLKKLDMD